METRLEEGLEGAQLACGSCDEEDEGWGGCEKGEGILLGKQGESK
jgi:hypothetical protein